MQAKTWKEGLEGLFPDPRNWKGEVATFPDVKAAWRKFTNLITIGFDSKLSNPPLGMMDSNALGEALGVKFCDMVDQVQGNIRQLLEKTEKKLAQMSDATDKAVLGATAAGIVVGSNAETILTHVRQAISLRNLNYAWALLNAAKAAGRIQGTEKGIDADFYAALNATEIHGEISEWRSFLSELTRYHDAAINSTRAVALGQWGTLLNFITAQAGQYEQLYNERINQAMGRQFSIRTMTLREA